MIADCAVYERGVRREGDCPLEEALEAAHSSPETFVWIALNEPTEEEFASVIEEFELHPLAVEDAVHAHQRPKLETYGPTLFIVLKPARYVDPKEIVSLSEIMLFLGDGFLITVRHGESQVLDDVRKMLETGASASKRSTTFWAVPSPPTSPRWGCARTRTCARSPRGWRSWPCPR